MPMKLSERMQKQLELSWCDPADAANELGAFLHNILSEVESLERSFGSLLFLKNDLVEMKRRYGEAGRDFSHYQWILDRLLGVSEEAKP